MFASFLSGLRWTITQLVTQKHELGKVKISLVVFFSPPLLFNEQKLWP
jgi:hypothetical protein